ncbi:MAG: tetratricopeptide repeat protein [Flavobacteriales bacterium]|nr:tetratricopeptide repeat protein [Flavobacteriales bacterium]
MNRILFIIITIVVLSSCGGSSKVVMNTTDGLNNSALSAKQNQKIQTLFFEGLKENALENYDRAENYFNDIIKIDKNHATALYHLALIKELKQDYENALIFAKRAAQIDPDNEWYKLILAGMYEVNLEYEEASKLYEQITTNNPKNIDAYYYWINTLAAEGKWKEMIGVMNLLEGQMGFSEELAMEREKLYLRGGDVDGAIQEVEGILEQDPKNSKYLNLLAELYQKKGDPDRALEIFNQIIAINPNDPYVHLSLSDYYKSLGETEKSREELLRAFEIPELSIDAKVRILLGYFTLNGVKPDKKKEAFQLGKVITDVHPEEAKAHSVYGDLLYRLDSNKLALSHYRKAIELDNSKFVLWNQVLILESEQQDFKSLYEDATKAIELFPAQPTFYLFKGIAAVQKNKYEEGIEALNTGKDLVYDNNQMLAQFYSTLGDSYYKMQNHAASDSAFDKSLEYDPNNVYVLNNYSYYLSLRKENLEKAEVMSKRSNEISPRSPSFADTYGWILYQEGKYEDAKLWIENAIDYGAEKNGVILEHYGDVLYQLGDVEGAKKQWIKAAQTKQSSELLDQKIETGKLVE